jgi:hypothetical protein
MSSVLRTRQFLTSAEVSILMNPAERWLSILFPPRNAPINKDDLQTVVCYQRRLARGSQAKILRFNATQPGTNPGN